MEAHSKENRTFYASVTRSNHVIQSRDQLTGILIESVKVSWVSTMGVELGSLDGGKNDPSVGIQIYERLHPAVLGFPVVRMVVCDVFSL